MEVETNQITHAGYNINKEIVRNWTRAHCIEYMRSNYTLDNPERAEEIWGDLWDLCQDSPPQEPELIVQEPEIFQSVKEEENGNSEGNAGSLDNTQGFEGGNRWGS